jgi:hypothetical protein
VVGVSPFDDSYLPRGAAVVEMGNSDEDTAFFRLRAGGSRQVRNSGKYRANSGPHSVDAGNGRAPAVSGRHLVVAAALGAVLVAGCGHRTGGSQPVAPPPAGTTTEQRPAEPAEPAELTIPKIGAHSTLVGLNLNADDSIEVPPVSAPLQAGWFAGGPRPGEPGPSVILGHVNGGGHAGIFARLHELQPGDEVLVGRTDGATMRFVVRKVDQIAKNQFPTEAVYGDTAGPELRLITCGGTFDKAAHSYRDNVIVYAG